VTRAGPGAGLLAGAPLIDRLMFGRPWRVRPAQAGPHTQGWQASRLTHMNADGLLLEGWLGAPLDQTPHTLVVYFGGRNEHVGWAPQWLSWLGPGWALACFNYRGFGRSAGQPAEGACVRDALELIAALCGRTGLPPERLALIGRSLGTCVAMQAAAHVQPAAIALVTPLASLVTRVRATVLLAPASPLVRGRFDSLAVAPLVRCPALVVLAARDLTVPHGQSLMLAERLSGLERVVRIPASHHLSVSRDVRTLGAVADFLNRAVGVDP